MLRQDVIDGIYDEAYSEFIARTLELTNLKEISGAMDAQILLDEFIIHGPIIYPESLIDTLIQ